MVIIKFYIDGRRLESVIHSPNFVKVLEDANQFMGDLQDSLVPLKFAFVFQILIKRKVVFWKNSIAI